MEETNKTTTETTETSTCKVISAEEWKPAPWRVTQYPTLAFMDKVAKNHAFSVIKSKMDFENKKIDYVVLVDDVTEAEKSISLDEAIKSFGWDGINFSEDKNLIYPVINGWVPEPKKPDYKTVDEHWGKDGYNWMAEKRMLPEDYVAIANYSKKEEVA